MGIRFECPNGHRLHVKQFLAGKRGICPECDARFIVPAASGGRAEAGANGTHEIVSSASAVAAPPVSAPPVAAPPVPEVKLSISTPPRLRSAHSRRVRKAKAATLGLSALVFFLLVALVLVLIR